MDLKEKDKMQNKEIGMENLKRTSGGRYREYGFCQLCQNEKGLDTFWDKNGNPVQCCDDCARQRG